MLHGATDPDVRGARSRTIIVLDEDPYLGYILSQTFGDDVVETATLRATILDLVESDPELIVVSDYDPRLDALRSLENRPRLLVVTDTRLDGSSAEELAQGCEAVLTRPFTPAEANRAARAALGLQLHAGDDRSGVARALMRWTDPTRLTRVAVGAVALGAVAEVASADTSVVDAMILAVAFVYVCLRALLRSDRPGSALVDVGFVGALLLVTGGVWSSYTPLALVVAFQAGRALDRPVGLMSGVGLSIVGVAGLVVAGDLGANLTISETAAWSLIFPLLAAVGTLMRDVRNGVKGESQRLLADANRVLSSLYDIARALPGGFETRTVASATLAEIRQELGAPAAVLILRKAGVYSVAGAYPHDETTGRILDVEETEPLIADGPTHLASATLDGGLRELLGDHERWTSTPIRHGDTTMGMLLIPTELDGSGEIDDGALGQITEEAGIAIANARLFGRIRELSIDEERGRLATELHDGVAQVLAHARLELEILGMDQELPESYRDEVGRLVRVVDRGVHDVRAVISDLRSSVVPDGVSAALWSYARDLDGFGSTQVRCRAFTSIRLDATIEAELFRIAQEAVSNALRHADAEAIEIRIEKEGSALRITVEDDGTGFDPGDIDDDSAGLGLVAMQERSSRIGADLAIGGRIDGGSGSRVTVRLPLDQEAHQRGTEEREREVVQGAAERAS